MPYIIQVVLFITHQHTSYYLIITIIYYSSSQWYVLLVDGCSYDRFVKVVHATARKHIPRGCRKNYVPGLTTDLAEQYNEYIQLYEQDHFSADTITTGDELAQALTVEQRKTWQALIENTDMTHNSKKPWSLTKKLSNDPRIPDQHVNVTPNQVAHQLIDPKWQGTKQTTTEQDQTMRPRKQQL